MDREDYLWRLWVSIKSGYHVDFFAFEDKRARS